MALVSFGTTAASPPAIAPPTPPPTAARRPHPAPPRPGCRASRRAAESRARPAEAAGSLGRRQPDRALREDRRVDHRGDGRDRRLPRRRRRPAARGRRRATPRRGSRARASSPRRSRTLAAVVPGNRVAALRAARRRRALLPAHRLPGRRDALRRRAHAHDAAHAAAGARHPARVPARARRHASREQRRMSAMRAQSKDDMRRRRRLDRGARHEHRGHRGDRRVPPRRREDLRRAHPARLRLHRERRRGEPARGLQDEPGARAAPRLPLARGRRGAATTATSPIRSSDRAARTHDRAPARAELRHRLVLRRDDAARLRPHARGAHRLRAPRHVAVRDGHAAFGHASRLGQRTGAAHGAGRRTQRTPRTRAPNAFKRPDAPNAPPAPAAAVDADWEEPPARTLAFPTGGAVVVRSSRPPPRGTKAEIDRATRLLAYLEAHAPDPHIVRLRLALRAGISRSRSTTPSRSAPTPWCCSRPPSRTSSGSIAPSCGAACERPRRARP